ncbi:MAG: PilN domain-containing protein [Sedimentisphaerales bacterium]
MVNLNFVPDDYVQNNESRRTNLLYLILLLAVMTALGGSFVTIKIRQRACGVKEKLVNQRMAQTKETMKKLDELQAKRKEMMKTALTTAELIEPVPRSILLASLTNNLPGGVSLMDLDMVQKEPKRSSSSASTSKFQAAQSGMNAEQKSLSIEKNLETHIAIQGLATSDLQVAEYIKRLTVSSLVGDVALVESKEYKVKDSTFRQFKLTAMLKNDVHLSKDDVENIRGQAEDTIWNF